MTGMNKKALILSELPLLLFSGRNPFSLFYNNAVSTASPPPPPQLYNDLLHPSPEEEKRRHKLKRLVQSPNSYFMDVKCPGALSLPPSFSLLSLLPLSPSLFSPFPSLFLLISPFLRVSLSNSLTHTLPLLGRSLTLPLSRLLQDHDRVQSCADCRSLCQLLNCSLSAHGWKSKTDRG